MFKKLTITGLSLLLAAVAVTSVSAATTVVVTPSDTEGWSTADTRPGGAVTYVAATSSPFGDGALKLTTNASTSAKAQYLKSVASTSIDDVTELAYSTQRVSGPAHAAASYQLLVDLNGATSSATSTGFTTFVFEPYQNGAVDSDDWQTWDVDAGQMWSSRSYTEGTNSVVAGAGGAPFYTLADIKEDFPDAVVIGFGVNIGSNNPSYDVNTDGVVFNGTTYDFELDPVEEEDTTAPAVPTHISPANGDTVTTAELDEVDWSTVTDPSSPVVYFYQSSMSSSTNPDGSFTSPAFSSSALSDSEINTAGTPEGTYFWHVRAVDDEGNSSAWSSMWSFTVDNSTTTPPTNEGPTNKDQCKKGGWMDFTNPSFKNQGQCVSSVAKQQR